MPGGDRTCRGPTRAAATTTRSTRSRPCGASAPPAPNGFAPRCAAAIPCSIVSPCVLDRLLCRMCTLCICLLLGMQMAHCIERLEVLLGAEVRRVALANVPACAPAQDRPAFPSPPSPPAPPPSPPSPPLPPPTPPSPPHPPAPPPAPVSACPHSPHATTHLASLEPAAG